MLFRRTRITVDTVTSLCIQLQKSRIRDVNHPLWDLAISSYSHIFDPLWISLSQLSPFLYKGSWLTISQPVRAYPKRLSTIFALLRFSSAIVKSALTLLILSGERAQF